MNKLKFNNNRTSSLASKEILKVTQSAKSMKILPPNIKIMLDYWAILRQKHPIAFPFDTRPSLKIAIVDDIALSLGVMRSVAKSFMAWYSFSGQYLELHKAGNPRYDLDGRIVSYVTQKQAEAKHSLLQELWFKGANLENKTTENNCNERSKSTNQGDAL